MKFKLNKPWWSIYPVVLMIMIPLLLAVNTWWNLRAFNRDANFILRHQAVSIAETLKPSLAEKINDPTGLTNLFNELVAGNEDIISIGLYQNNAGEMKLVAASTGLTDQAVKSNLIPMAVSYSEPMAGLVYDATLKKNIWEVVTPVNREGETPQVMVVRLDTKTVATILERTIKDSVWILVGLITAVVLLLINHFYFYLRTIKTRQLEELDKLKDEFISMAAHELRTPMVAMLGYFDLIKYKLSPAEKEKLGEEFEVLTGLTKELSELVNDLLDVSRIDQGRMTVNWAQLDINEVIVKVLTTLAPTAQTKGLKLVYNQVALPPIRSDADRLRQILTNIIGNSLKYTLQGQVAVNVFQDKEQLVIEVKDTGIGIPAEELPKLFTKFHRVWDEKTKDVRGTGLGLWITKEMTELIGGTIVAESIYGTGTRMIVRLPLK